MPLSALTKDLRLVVATWANSANNMHFITHGQADAIQRDYDKRMAAVLGAPPGSPLSPLFGRMNETTLLPHGTSFGPMSRAP